MVNRSLERFEAELAALPSCVGERNRRLFVIALKGRAAGLEPDEVTRRIVDSSGEPPLGFAEVDRAVRKVWVLPEGGCFNQSHKLQYRPEKRRGNTILTKLVTASGASHAQPTGYASKLVRELIDQGGGEATSHDLIAASPLPIRREPRLQALDFCVALDEPDSCYFFLGEPRQKRTFDRLHKLSEIEAELAFGDDFTLPTHILANDLTGKPAKNERGEESYALEACLAHRRYAVVEFDAMPLKVQAAFWLGAIRSELLPIRSLVYSGGKSIHALLRLKEEESFASQWDTLARTLASDADAAFRCDLACRNPGRMTRFPGAVRPETGLRQTLLYLA